MPQKKPVVLTLSGHDPSGGAGIQADIETLAALDCHACGVITALTDQDTRNVISVYPQNPERINAQLDTILNDFSVAAIKIGLMGHSSIALAISECLKRYATIPVILDPVLTAGGGSSLSDPDLIRTMQERLFSMTTILTPNSQEARILSSNQKSLETCGQSLLALGCQNVLITGTHESDKDVVNRYFSLKRKTDCFNWERLPHSYHGSGCTLAAAIAGFIALGFDDFSAVEHAQEYTWNTLKNGYQPGKGQYIPDRRISWKLSEIPAPSITRQSPGQNN